MKIGVVKKKHRFVIALIGALVAVLCFVLFPSTFFSQIFHFPVTPILFLMGLAALLLHVQKAPFALRIGAKLALYALCVLMLLYATEVAAGGTSGWNSAFGYMYVFLLACGAVLYALTGSLPWAVRILALVAALFSVVNYFVLAFRGAPLLPEDILAAGTAFEVLPNYSLSLSPPLAEAALVFLALIFMTPKLAMPRGKRSIRIVTRSVSGVLAATFFVLTANGTYFNVHEYYPNYWNQTVSMENHGAAMNFLSNIICSASRKPDTYSLDMVDGISSGYLSDSVEDAGAKPDIILILGESWSDMAPEETVETNIPVTPFLDSFETMEHGLRRKLLVASYGGGTALSEFQMFAGVNAIYGLHQSPLVYNVTDPVPNLVSVLKQLGYDTTAMHTGTSTAWGRDEAFPLLGFDNFYSGDDLKDADSTYQRYYLSDKNLYDRTLSILETADTPQFVYAITIQTHGGYTSADYDSPIRIIEPQGSFPQAEQYLGLLNNSDQAFADFIATLEQRERPTLVLAFGDHLPYVEDSYVEFLEDGKDATWRNETFFVMWANYPLPEETTQMPPMIGLNYLGSKLMEAAELPLTGYQKFLLEGVQYYPAISYDMYFDTSGLLRSNNQITDWTYYNDQSVMQYNLVHDLKNRASEFFNLWD